MVREITCSKLQLFIDRKVTDFLVLTNDPDSPGFEEIKPDLAEAVAETITRASLKFGRSFNAFVLAHDGVSVIDSSSSRGFERGLAKLRKAATIHPGSRFDLVVDPYTAEKIGSEIMIKGLPGNAYAWILTNG